jgi:hypothetical protein
MRIYAATARSGHLPTMAAIPALSERERQTIDGLIKGQSMRMNGTSVAHRLRQAK